MTLFTFDHRESAVGTHCAERRLAFANKEVPQKYVANQNSGKTLWEQAKTVRERMSKVVLRIQKKSDDKDIPEEIRLKYKRLEASIKNANEGLKSKAEASIAEYENTIRDVENTIAQLERENGIEEKDSYATEMRTKWTNKLLNKDKSVRAETFIWNNRDAFVLYVPDDWVIGMDLPEGNVNDVSESRTSYMFFKKDLPESGVISIDIPGKGMVNAAFTLVADQTDGSRKDLKIDLSGTSSAEAIPAPTTLEDETPPANVAPASMSVNTPRSTVPSAYDDATTARFRSMRPANSGAAYSNSGAASEPFSTQPQQRPMSAEEIRKHNIRVAYHPNNRHNEEAVRRIMKSKTPVTPLGDEGIIENTVPKDKWWTAPYSMNPNFQAPGMPKAGSRGGNPDRGTQTEEGRRLVDHYSAENFDKRVNPLMKAGTEQVSRDVQAINTKIAAGGVHREGFDVYRIPGYKMYITFPASVLGESSGETVQIVYQPNEKKFSTERDAALARRAGIYCDVTAGGFQRNTSRLNIFFPNEGEYSISIPPTNNTPAGESRRVKVESLAARQQAAIEKTKINAAKKNGVNTWGLINDGKPELDGTVRMYAVDANNNLFAYNAASGTGVMHRMDPLTGKWTKDSVGTEANAAALKAHYLRITAKPEAVSAPTLTETPAANPAVVSGTPSVVTSKGPEFKNAEAIKKTFADFSAKNGVKVTYSNEMVGTPDMDAIDATLVKLEAALQALDSDMKKDLGTSFTIYVQSSASESNYDGTSFYIRSSDSAEEMEEILEAGFHPKAPKSPGNSVTPIMGGLSVDKPKLSEGAGPAAGNSMPNINVQPPVIENGKPVKQAQRPEFDPKDPALMEKMYKGTVGKDKVLVSHNDSNVDTQRLVIFNKDHPAYDAILKTNKELFLTDDIGFSKDGRSITMNMAEWKKIGGNDDGSWTGDILPAELREKTDYAEIAMKEATSISKRIRPAHLRDNDTDFIRFENVSNPDKKVGEFEGTREIVIKVTNIGTATNKSVNLPFIMNAETEKFTPSLAKMPKGIEMLLDRKEYSKDELVIALRRIKWEDLKELS